jgi:hypothetical protein
MRALTLARVVVGTACVAAPGRLLALVGAPDHDDRRVRAVARVLGLRVLAQAGVDLARGGSPVVLDVGVDASHALSMVPVAVAWPVHRRAACVSAAVAAGLAALAAADHGRSSTWE